MEKLLEAEGAVVLAPWNYCGEQSIRKDDVLAEVAHKIQSGDCERTSYMYYEFSQGIVVTFCASSSIQ